MKTTYFNIRFTLILVAVSLCSSHAFSHQPSRFDLRLRLNDSDQVARTTSLNWFDLHSLHTVLLRSPAAKSAFDVTPEYAVKILVDAGHGGHDLGAPGLYGIHEKDIVLKITQLVQQQLKSYGNLNRFPMDIMLTRGTDVFIPLKERVRQANEWGADLFVSIHANSSSVHSVKGFEVYFMSHKASDRAAQELALIENEDGTPRILKPGVASILEDVQANVHIGESSEFAEVVYRSMSDLLRPNKRGVRQAPFMVLAGTKMPALLIEVGYVTNRQEAKQLKKGHYLKRISEAISAGVVKFAKKLRDIG